MSELLGRPTMIACGDVVNTGALARPAAPPRPCSKRQPAEEVCSKSERETRWKGEGG